MSDFLSFHLSREFVDSYRDRPIPWGYVDAHGTSVSEITYLRTYSRVKEDGSKETWTDTVERVINGTFSIQKDHAKQNRLPWSDVKAQRSAERMFHDLWNFRWSPPGRGLFAMGSPRVHGERGSSTALNNCSVVSSNLMTKNDPAKPFVKLMDNSMLGVGVGFDTDGYKKGFRVHRPEESNEVFVVPDTREGWSESVGLLINAYLKPNQSLPRFDYSEIRAAGEPIKTFGGIAPGPDPLIQLHERLIRVFEEKVGRDADSMLILDIANIIGVGVVSGGVRRCMPQGTMVHTSRGLVPIESVEVGDEVVTYGAPSKVLANMDQGVQRTNVVRTEIGQLEATPNHRVATVKSIYGDVEWKRVDELTPGDKLIFPRKVAPGRRTHFPPFSYMKPENSTTCVDITVPELDTDSAWLLGLFLGDGYVYPNFKNNGRNGYVSIACDPGNREIVERAVAQLERFGVKATPKEGFKDDRCVKITAISKQLAWYLSQFKTANETISVPDFIKESTPEIRAAFLAGVLDSDGALNNKPVVACASVYPEFLKELQDLYASLGIPTAVKLNRPAKGTWQDLYHLNLKGSHPMEDLVRYILPHSNKELTRERGKEQFYYGFNRDMVLQNLRYKDFQGVWTPNTKQMTVTAAARVLNREVEWYPIEVVSIEEGRTVQTYDIEVQDEHNFIAHGYVVHNSALLAAGDPDDTEFISAKDLEKNPNRSEWFFMSNNSIKVNTGDDLSHILDDIKMIGEPGVLWMDVAHNHGRIEDGIRTDDQKTVATNPCLTGSMRLMTKEYGFARFDELDGKNFQVWNGHRWSDSKVWYTGEKQAYRVTLTNGQFIELTGDHVLEDAYGNEVTVETLTEDTRFLPMQGPGSWEGHEIDPDTAVLLGLLCGDGSLDNRRGYNPIIKTQEPEVIDFVLDYGNRRGYGWFYDKERTTLHLKGFRDDYESYGFDFAPLPERTLPKEIFSFSSETVKNILRGLYSANGSSMPKHRRVMLKTTSPELVEQVRLLLVALGLVPYNTTNKPSKIRWDNGEFESRESYDLNIGSRWGYEKFQDEIGFLHEHKSQRIESDGVVRIRPVKVRSVEPLGKVSVYDFHEPETHWGLVNGFKTHNCGEIFLEGGGELCCLSDVYIGRQESKEEFFRSLKNAYLYAKTVTLLPTEDPDTNAIIQRNRRIGVSLSGVADFADNEGLPKLREWMDDGYKYLRGLDKKYSEWLCVRESIRLTTSKPGGTTGIVFGQSPGVHWSPGGKTFLRGIIFQKNDPIVAQLEAAGYTVEESAYTPETSVFVQFPVKSQAKRSESEVSFFEKANLAATAQRYWADNSVSVTLSFDRDTEGDQLPLVLQMFEGQLKSASFLPMGKETYLQMPYQSMTQSEYDEVEGTCLPVDLGPVYRGNALEAVGDNYCTTSSCEIRAVTEANES